MILTPQELSRVDVNHFALPKFRTPDGVYRV